MSQDIVELLLRLAPNCEWVTERTAMREAATLITTLTAERDEYIAATKLLGLTVEHNLERATTAEALVQSMREALENIRELNFSGADENGNQWANSDLIDQEITAALSRSEV